MENFMPRPVMVLSSDWHLSPQSWKKHPNIQKDSYFSLMQIVDLSIKLNVPLVGAGDLFDVKHPYAESVVFCSEQMKKLKRAGLNMYYVQGQHEYSETPWLSICDNAIHVDFLRNRNERVLNVNGITMCGLDIQKSGTVFATACNTLRHEVGINKIDLFITHQVWVDFIHKSDVNFCFKNATFAKIVYTGDFHKTEVLDVDGTACLSSGSINMQANNESPHKCVFILNDDLSYDRYALATRPFISFTIKNEKELSEVLDRNKDSFFMTWPYKNLPDEISTPLVCIKYQRTLPRAYELLSDKFKSFQWHWDIAATDFTSAEMLAAADRKPTRELITIEDCAAKLADPESVKYKDAIRVFNSKNAEQEILAMREEHLTERA
jgi:hypothetical protein